MHLVLIDRCILTNLSQKPLNGDHNFELDRSLLMRGGPLQGKDYDYPGSLLYGEMTR